MRNETGAEGAWAETIATMQKQVGLLQQHVALLQEQRNEAARGRQPYHPRGIPWEEGTRKRAV